jgi:hypothetical protein
MNNSLEMWMTKLTAQFRTNASTALQEADQMKHSFDKEADLPVRDYLRKKQALYIEAGEVNEDLIVRRLHEGLDPTLRLAVKLDSTNTIERFTASVYAQEASARDQHASIRKMLKESQTKNPTDDPDQYGQYNRYDSYQNRQNGRNWGYRN